MNFFIYVTGVTVVAFVTHKCLLLGGYYKKWFDIHDHEPDKSPCYVIVGLFSMLWPLTLGPALGLLALEWAYIRLLRAWKRKFPEKSENRQP